MLSTSSLILSTVRCSCACGNGRRRAGVPLPLGLISLHTKWPLIVCLVPFSAHSYTFVPKHIGLIFSLIGIVFKCLLDYRMLSIFALKTLYNRALTQNAHDTGCATSPPHLDCPTLAVFRWSENFFLVIFPFSNDRFYGFFCIVLRPLYGWSFPFLHFELALKFTRLF